MSRTSRDQFDEAGRLVNGFDYDLQCWVRKYIVQDCGHKQGTGCGCFGRCNWGQTITMAREGAELEEVSGVYLGMKEEGLI
jgi:hypothetical protein